MATLQTLDRGLRALRLIAAEPAGTTIADLSAKLGIHKAITYRIVSTLEQHGMIVRSGDGMILLGGSLMTIAARFEPQFRTAAGPLLERLSKETGATSCIAMAQGGECVVTMVREAGEGFLRVAYRLGSCHPLSRGATGLAILAGRPGHRDDPPAVVEARQLGYAVTKGELQQGAIGVASPVLLPHSPRGALEPCVGVVAMEDIDVSLAASAVQECAARLRLVMTGGA